MSESQHSTVFSEHYPVDVEKNLKVNVENAEEPAVTGKEVEVKDDQFLVTFSPDDPLNPKA